jgi:hypothetical protein
MRSLAVLACFLLTACSTIAEVPARIAYYMQENAAVWNSGDVCRHAAARLALLADRRGDEYRIPLFGTTDPQGHTLIVIRYGALWYGIDSVVTTDSGKYSPVVQTFTGYHPVIDLPLYSSFTTRELVEYEGDADDEAVACWLNEEECLRDKEGRIAESLDEISNLKRLIGVGESALKILEKQIPGLWEHYLERVREAEPKEEEASAN